MIQPRFLVTAIALTVLLVVFVACDAGSGGGEPASTYTPGQKVSANNASRDDLAAAFDYARIGNAGKWAREVEEYRPYPDDDPAFAKLRGELAKYNPAPGIVDQIIAQLVLP